MIEKTQVLEVRGQNLWKLGFTVLIISLLIGFGTILVRSQIKNGKDQEIKEKQANDFSKEKESFEDIGNSLKEKVQKSGKNIQNGILQQSADIFKNCYEWATSKLKDK